MQNLSSLAFTQTDLGKFLTIFEENFRIFQEKLLSEFKKKMHTCHMPNFSSLASTQTDLGTFLTIFEENFAVDIFSGEPGEPGESAQLRFAL
jgi:hypothetical protein